MRTLQAFMVRQGDVDMPYTHVVNKGGLRVRSPLDVDVVARLGCALRVVAIPPGRGPGRGGWKAFRAPRGVGVVMRYL